jgi:hypothetical protein
MRLLFRLFRQQEIERFRLLSVREGCGVRQEKPTEMIVMAMGTDYVVLEDAIGVERLVVVACYWAVFEVVSELRVASFDFELAMPNTSQSLSIDSEKIYPNPR